MISGSNEQLQQQLEYTLLVTYSYAYACRNIFNTIRTSGHSSLKKVYLSLYWKGCVWEVSWRLNKDCNILTTLNSSGYSIISFPFSCAAQPGAWGPSLCWDMVLIPASFLQLIWTSCCRGYMIIWRPPTSCERHNSHSIQPIDSQGCPLISSTGCTCYLHRCISYFDSSAGSEVNMQHTKAWLSQLVNFKNVIWHFRRTICNKILF